jgi:hypothetical protein
MLSSFTFSSHASFSLQSIGLGVRQGALSFAEADRVVDEHAERSDAQAELSCHEACVGGLPFKFHQTLQQCIFSPFDVASRLSLSGGYELLFSCRPHAILRSNT